MPLVKYSSSGSSRAVGSTGVSPSPSARQRSSSDSQPSGARPTHRRVARSGTAASTFPRPAASVIAAVAPGLIEAVRDVLRGQQVGPGHRDRPDPNRAKQRRVPLRDPRQHHEHVVALAHPEIQQHPRCLARGARQISRRLLGDNLAHRVDRQHRERVGVLGRPRIDDVEHGVEALRHVDVVAGAFGVDIRQARRAIASGTGKRNDRHSSDPTTVLDPATGLAIRISMQLSSVRLRWRNGRQRQAVVAKVCLSGDVGVYVAFPGPSARRTRAGETPSDGADEYGG